ncbi:MAG TPA: nuclear transport factor 2 family protein, partial [Acidimicrobiales bacterium]|nr:nuclear transport factor 2 family protein [Acidimicrobiales bacterium]
SVLGDPGMVTQHHGHHPEITFVSSAAAEGTWYLQDRVIIPGADLEIAGTAFYSDRYVKEDGSWKIAHTGYMRVFEEHRTHSTMAVRSLRSRFGPGS